MVVPRLAGLEELPRDGGTADGAPRERPEPTRAVVKLGRLTGKGTVKGITDLPTRDDDAAAPPKQQQQRRAQAVERVASTSRVTGFLVLPGFKKQLPDFSAGVDMWNARHKRDRALDEPAAALCSEEDAAPFLRKLLPSAGHKRVLEIGCGMRPLGPWIVSNKCGAGRVVCVDFSPICVGSLRQRFAKSSVKFLRADVRRLRADLERAIREDLGPDAGFEAPQFDAVCDKGTLDCLFAAEDNVRTVFRVLRDLHGLLDEGGVFLCFTGVDPALRKPFLDEAQWDVTWDRVGERRCWALLCAKKTAAEVS